MKLKLVELIGRSWCGGIFSGTSWKSDTFQFHSSSERQEPFLKPIELSLIVPSIIWLHYSTFVIFMSLQPNKHNIKGPQHSTILTKHITVTHSYVLVNCQGDNWQGNNKHFLFCLHHFLFSIKNFPLIKKQLQYWFSSWFYISYNLQIQNVSRKDCQEILEIKGHYFDKF